MHLHTIGKTQRQTRQKLAMRITEDTAPRSADIDRHHRIIRLAQDRFETGTKLSQHPISGDSTFGKNTDQVAIVQGFSGLIDRRNELFAWVF